MSLILLVLNSPKGACRGAAIKEQVVDLRMTVLQRSHQLLLDKALIGLILFVLSY